MQAAVFSHFASHNFAAYDPGRSYVAALCADLVVLKLYSQFLSIFGVITEACDIRLRNQGRHIHIRRTREAHLIIEAIPQALTHVKYVGRRYPDKHIYTAVGKSESRYLLLVGIEFVRAESAPSGKDEAWVTTAYFLKEPELRRQLRKQVLRPLISHA
jgi:hypothetical protein